MEKIFTNSGFMAIELFPPATSDDSSTAHLLKIFLAELISRFCVDLNSVHFKDRNGLMGWNVQMSNMYISMLTDSSFETGAIFTHACWVSPRTTMSVCQAAVGCHEINADITDHFPWAVPAGQRFYISFAGSQKPCGNFLLVAIP